MFNMSAVNALRSANNLSVIPPGDPKSHDIASLLALPGMDAKALWLETAHSRPNVVKEVIKREWEKYPGSFEVSLFCCLCNLLCVKSIAKTSLKKPSQSI